MASITKGFDMLWIITRGITQTQMRNSQHNNPTRKDCGHTVLLNAASWPGMCAMQSTFTDTFALVFRTLLTNDL